MNYQAGLAAGMTKAGGVLVLAFIVASRTAPGIAATALIGAVPLLIAAVAFLWVGPETKRRRRRTRSPNKKKGRNA